MIRDIHVIGGAGGGGGGGGGSESTDTLRGRQTAEVLDLISEGECEGLVNGLKSVYFDGVPLQAADDSFNFQGWSIQTRPGTQGQSSIDGADGVQNELGVGVDVLFATPIVRTITNAAVDSCRVTIVVPQLSKLSSRGDLGGSSFQWAVEVQSNGGGYVEIFRETVSGKTMSRYPRAKKFKLPGAAPWDIRVRRLSADSGSSNDVTRFAWATYAEIQSLRLRYPNSALVRTRIGAEQFSRIPVRSFDWLGLRIQVPTNYDPKTRVYSGVWDGTFKTAWTDNPAWIYHDMVRNNRYGLGRYIETTDALKWELYAIARYCDQQVPDGYGGMEPRFRASPVLTAREQAYKVLTDLAAIFRGMAYWSNTDMAVVQDAPSDPVALFTPSNVVGGVFTYSGASNAKRYSSVVVWFNNLPDRGKLVPEIVVDRALEARYGVKQLELSPMGIWSRGQAQRIGKWVLYTQQRETEGVVFKVGLDGALVPPGKVFQIADPSEAGERLGGRVRSATTLQVTLDAEVTLAAGESYTLKVMLPDPTDAAKLITQERAVTTAAGTIGVLTVAAAFSAAPAPESVWILRSDAVEPTTWRCIAVTESGDDQFTITALAHAPQKYELIEQGIEFEKPSISRLSPTALAPTNMLFTEVPYLQGSSTRSRVSVSWRAPAPGLTFQVSWRLNSGPWTDAPSTSENTFDVDGLARGLLEARVRSRNALGNLSVPLAGSTTLVGKTALPVSPTGFTATVVQGGVKFAWNASQADDYLTNTLRIGAQTLFEGAASTWTWPWPVLGTYTVTLTEWDTSLGESVAVGVVVTIDSALLVQWASLSGKPILFRVSSRGANDSSAALGTGLYNGETLALLSGSARSYAMARIRRSDGVVTFSQRYDVFAVGADTGHPLGYGRGAAELAADLNASGSNVIVVVWTYDEPQSSRLTAGLAAAMYRCGASRGVFGSPEFQYRSAYVLIGIGGCGEGSGYEAYNGSVSNDSNAFCDVSFTLQAGNLIITGGGATPRTLADYSYTGDLNATVGAPNGTYVGGTLAENVESVAGAQAKANAANANAVATAAASAQAKADLAKVQAQAYADGIVTAEEARAIADATTKANNAQSAATAAAAADATAKANAALAAAVADSTSKANAASANAISAAAIAAQAKADLAKTQAQAYADGIVTAEEARAINDATVKANNAQIAATAAAAADATAKANLAATTATWAGVTGTGRPSDNATADVALIGRGVVVSGNSATKISGASAWDADVYSRDSYTGGAYASGVAVRTDRSLLFGLNSDPLSDSNYTSLDAAIYLRADGIADIFENGVGIVSFGAYAANDVFAVVYDGATIRYMKNGVVARTVAAAAGLNFFFDSSFAEAGASLRNIRFGPMSAVTGIDTRQIVPGSISNSYSATLGHHDCGAAQGEGTFSSAAFVTFIPAVTGEVTVSFGASLTYVQDFTQGYFPPRTGSGIWGIVQTTRANNVVPQSEGGSGLFTLYALKSSPNFPQETTRQTVGRSLRFSVTAGVRATFVFVTSKSGIDGAGNSDSFQVDNLAIDVTFLKR